MSGAGHYVLVCITSMQIAERSEGSAGESSAQRARSTTSVGGCQLTGGFDEYMQGMLHYNVQYKACSMLSHVLRIIHIKIHSMTPVLRQG